MNTIQTLLTDHIDIWTAADTGPKSGRGRSSANAASVYGIRKLRELILEFAVRGKLVPQDKNDEPACELLKRIQVEKSKLIAEGKIKKDKPLPPIAENEEPFDLPFGWEWVRLGEIAEAIRGVTYGKSDASDNPLPDYVPLLRGNNINRVLNFDNPVFVPKRLLNEAQYVKTGDIVIAMSSGSADLVGKAAQATENFHGGFGAFCGVIRSVSDEVFSFFGFFFQTPLYRNCAAGHGKGIGINNLQKTALQTLEIPLPPFAEQQRIVAKIDELMALCDQLETQHTNAAEAHEKLVSHLLGTLTQSQSAADFIANWQRIAAHFDTLFTTEASIDALKQTLLQLAVMGKLVPQDTKDEPASKLVHQALLEKRARIDDGKIKKDKVVPLDFDNVPFLLPNNWCWTRLGNLVIDLRYGTSVKCSYDGGGIPVLRIPNIGNEVVSIADLKYGVLSEDEQASLALETGDALLIRSNGSASLVGKTALVTEEALHCAFAGYLVRLRLMFNQISPTYFQLVMKTQYIRGCIEKPIRTTSGVKNINSTEISNLLISLPPLGEQHRIVVKVDELMALCDQLKFHITAANQLQQKLADVVVEQAIS